MRIDVHHHYFPSDLFKEELNRVAGWRSPEGYLPWSPELSLKCMEHSGIDLAILSLPAIASQTVGETNRRLARQRNHEMADIRQKYPKQFGFFATLPMFDDAEGVLLEIAYALDVLHADGFGIPSSYGVGPSAKYIGHDDYDKIWAELNARNAVVFLHGTQTPSSTPIPHEFLGLPITEVPNETFKAAAHLVITGRKRKYSNISIILAHMGGCTPMLAPRVSVLSRHMGCELNENEILEDFKSFYFDTALSASESNLALMQSFVGMERLVFGTDLPAVSTEMCSFYTRSLESHLDPERLAAVSSGNIWKLIPRLDQVNG